MSNTRKELKELKSRTFVVIYSTATKTIYVDRERKSYVFFFRHGLKEFLEIHPNTACHKVEPVDNTKHFLSECYREGALYIVFENNITQSIRLNKSMVENDFYNTSLNLTYNWLLQSGKKKYITELKDKKFIIPIEIGSLHKGDFFSYPTARLSDDKTFFLAFTDLMEFNLWKEKTKEIKKEEETQRDFKPLLISAASMFEISSGMDFIVNIFGKRALLPKKLLTGE